MKKITAVTYDEYTGRVLLFVGKNYYRYNIIEYGYIIKIERRQDASYSLIEIFLKL